MYPRKKFQRQGLRWLSLVGLVTLASSPSRGDEPAVVPIYRHLGHSHFAITTYRADAQEYFDQGLRWMHAFNLEEAEASFREAARRDPSCAMCAWGIAFSLGPLDECGLWTLVERESPEKESVATELAGSRPAAESGISDPGNASPLSELLA